MNTSNSSTRDLLVRGVAAAKARDIQEAHFYFEWLLRLDPPEDERIEALYWLSEVSPDAATQRDYLEEILAIDLGEPCARRKLAILDGKLKPGEIIDPDRQESKKPGPVSIQADQFVCPNCGGRMTYTPDGESLTCEFCEARQYLKKDAGKVVSEEDFVVAMATAGGHQTSDQVHVFTCQGCGVEFILPGGQLSGNCPYCQSSYVLKQKETHRLFIPDGIIPFRIDEQQAKACLRAWMENQKDDIKFLSTSFHAVYLPVWSFYIDGEITWRCERQVNRAWIEIEGEEPVIFDHVLVPATHHLSETFGKAIKDYDLNLVVSYDERYLAGLIAESYGIPVSDASLDARQMVSGKMRSYISQRQTGQVRNLILNSSRMRIEAFQLILVPIWSTLYEVAGITHAILIDGQKGNVYTARNP